MHAMKKEGQQIIVGPQVRKISCCKKSTTKQKAKIYFSTAMCIKQPHRIVTGSLQSTLDRHVVTGLQTVSSSAHTPAIRQQRN
jgi:hypothetical protein